MGAILLKDLISKLNLEPLIPEGGYFKRTFQSEHTTVFSNENRPTMSSIYYLVTPDSFSALHKLTTDEIYHFYYGDPLELHVVDPKGEHQIQTLGTDIMSGEVPQFAVKSQHWQCSRIKSNRVGYSLVGTTVSPGFEFSDFILGTKDDLSRFSHEVSETLAKFVR